MLAGIEANRIIVGAYVDRDGGVCPMLAAHRNGGRTSLASFARAWDRYTKANGRPRTASARELNTLRAMLEVSIAVEELEDLRPGITERKVPSVPPRDTGERDRTSELRHKPGWAWMRPFRRLDDYEQALRELEELEERRERQRELERV
jgi:hypothetical protein